MRTREWGGGELAQGMCELTAGRDLMSMWAAWHSLPVVVTNVSLKGLPRDPVGQHQA